MTTPSALAAAEFSDGRQGLLLNCNSRWCVSDPLPPSAALPLTGEYKSPPCEGVAHTPSSCVGGWMGHSLKQTIDSRNKLTRFFLPFQHRNLMRHWLTGLLTMFTVAVLMAQQSGTPFRIEKLDAALDEIIAPDATLETLGDRFALTEGPVWVPDGRDGYLLFSDNAANVIYKWATNSPLSVFLEKSGFTGTDNTRVGAQTIAGRVAILLIGSNGL